MRTVLILSAAALALSACQRPAEEADATVTPEDAMAEAAARATADAETSGSSSGANPGAASADQAGVNAGATAPAGDVSADTMGATPSGGMAPVSQATRDGAKEKAERTNLHPAG